MTLQINGPKVIITLVVLAGIFLLLWRGCGGNDAAVAKANALADGAIKANAIKDAKMDVLGNALDHLRADSENQRFNTEALAEEANNALTAQADAVDNSKKYQNKYEQARKQLDTVLALASCDSLTLAIARERTKAQAAQKACSTQVNNLGDILANRNQQIANLNQQVAVLKQPASIVNDALHAVKAAAKEPWIKGYVGASVMGNQTSFGFGPDVSLLFRGGLMVRGGAVLMGSQVMGVVGVAKLLSFKRK
jgi:hypothetical protein